MTEERTHPHFLIELPDRDLHEAGDITHAEAAQQIRDMERGIRTNPYAFRTLLRALGRAAEAGTLRLGQPMGAPKDTDPDVASMVGEYFRLRLDAHVDYDPPTEDTIAGDTHHADRVGQSTSAVSYRVSLTGSDMSHGMRAPQDAELRRDTARVSRLASYVQEVIAWQEGHVDGVA